MTPRTHPISPRLRSPRGIALLLVICIMALAAILGYAMLAASSLQATASGNAVAAAVARAQAESGIHLATYELLSGNVASTGATWSNVTFSSSGTPVTTMPGSVTVQIGALTNHCCSIVSTGSSGSSSGGGSVSRTITAEVQVGTPLQIDEAGAFNSQVTVSNSMTFNSSSANAPAISTTSSVTNSNGNITGNVIASSYSGPNPTNGTVSTTVGAPAPTNSAYVTDYTQPYVYQGTTYTPVSIGSSITATTTLGPTASNPLGVYYASGSLNVSKSLTINGTLVVKGTLTDSSSISISPTIFGSSEYFPAMVVDSKLQMSGHTASVSAWGVVYVGAGITGIGTNASTNITVNGAMLITGGAINNTYTGSATVNYNPTWANVPNFDATDWNSSSGVKIISWSE